ncbi:MAG: glycosyltransferase [Gammaproteobacteria bacterium]|nr:MAG: glycosyltransferase [Gammaproteobacteria bacterium]
MTVQKTQPARISFLLDNLTGGGAEKVILNLARGFARVGHQVDLLVCKVEGVLSNSIPAGVNLVPLESASPVRGLLCAMKADPAGTREILGAVVNSRKVPKGFKYIPAIAEHLKTNKVDVLLSALPKANINAVLAKNCCKTKTRVVVGAHINFSSQVSESLSRGKNRLQHLRPVIQRCYQRADAVVAVSKGVAKDIAQCLGLDPENVATIYNPIETLEMEALSREAVDHPWFESGAVPVILGAGRFVAQKDFPLLVRAFAKVRQRRNVRLMLLGGDETSGPQAEHRKELLGLADRLGVGEDFEMPGFKVNPYPYLRKASVFVLSSRYEGFGNVVVEALLAGCPVVSTDCPSGPAEILHNGEFGRLVPVSDETALAGAICDTLDSPRNGEFLKARGKVFSIERAVESYSQIFFGPSSPDGVTRRVTRLSDKRSPMQRPDPAQESLPREARK